MGMRDRSDPDGRGGEVADALDERDLTRAAAELRTDDAARSRSRQRWLRSQAEEEATFGGVLVDLGERARPVVISCRSGRSHQGWIVGVGVDCVTMLTQRDERIVVVLDAIAFVRPQAHEEATVGDRCVSGDASLAEVLAEWASERPQIHVVAFDGTAGVRGELRAVGRDVLTLRLDGNPPTTGYVRLASVSEVSATASG